MAPPKPVSATGSVQGSVATPTEESKKAPEAETTATNPNDQAWKLHPFAGLDVNFYDAGKGTDGLFSSSFGALNDQTWLALNAGFLTNVNTGKVRFEFGPLLRLGFLRGGPQTNESKITDIGVGGRAALDWNRVYGFNGLRLFGRFDFGYDLGYAFGETTANPSIRKYEQDALSHQLRGALEVIGYDFGGCMEAGINANGGTYIADGSRINNTGMMVGVGFEIRHGCHEAPPVVVQEGGEVCTSALRDAQYYWDKAKQLQADNTKLHEELDSVKGYLEARPENPITVDKITKAQWLGYVETELGKMHGDKVAEIEKAANKAKISKKSEAAEIFKAVEGMKAEDVDLVIKLADTEYPADSYNFYTHNLGEELPIPEQLEQIDPKDCDTANAYAEEMRKIYEGYLRNNGVLTQKVDDIIMIGGLEGKPEVEQIVAASILDVNQPNFQTSRASPEDVEELNKYVSGKTDLAVDDAGLVKILNTKRHNNKAGRPTKVFGSAKLELEHLRELADWLNGKSGLDSAKDLEIKIGGGDPNNPNAKVNESAEGIKKIREWQKTVKLKIEGHTDQRGDNDMNQKLSQQRADAIRAILIGFGVAPERLEAIGYGEERPVAAETGSNEEIAAAQAKNRRVVFRLAGASLPSAPTVEEWGGTEETLSKEAEHFDAGANKPAEEVESKKDPKSSTTREPKKEATPKPKKAPTPAQKTAAKPKPKAPAKPKSPTEGVFVDD